LLDLKKSITILVNEINQDFKHNATPYEDVSVMFLAFFRVTAGPPLSPLTVAVRRSERFCRHLALFAFHYARVKITWTRDFSAALQRCRAAAAAAAAAAGGGVSVTCGVLDCHDDDLSMTHMNLSVDVSASSHGAALRRAQLQIFLLAGGRVNVGVITRTVGSASDACRILQCWSACLVDRPTTPSPLTIRYRNVGTTCVASVLYHGEGRRHKICPPHCLSEGVVEIRAQLMNLLE